MCCCCGSDREGNLIRTFSLDEMGHVQPLVHPQHHHPKLKVESIAVTERSRTSEPRETLRTGSVLSADVSLWDLLQNSDVTQDLVCSGRPPVPLEADHQCVRLHAAQTGSLRTSEEPRITWTENFLQKPSECAEQEG